MSLVAIIGRPNVGKSTLFNRLTGTRQAIVSDEPGTTRDRIMAPVQWGEHSFTIVDTGGLEPDEAAGFWKDIRLQVEVALDQADVIVFLTDVTSGLTATERDIADMLRRRSKPVVLAINKVDNRKRQMEATEFYELDLGDPVMLSAYHNFGVDDLVIAISQHLPPEPATDDQPDAMRVAIVGRPNVGKSMLLNAILGDRRAIVSDVPGTTRDAIDTSAQYEGEPVVFVDTAGIRRRGRIEQGIEKYSVLRAVRAMERADVAFLVLDATDPGAAQDQHISGYLMEFFKAIVIVVNKWDLAEEHGLDQAEVNEWVRDRFKFISYAPVRFTSALTGEGIPELMAAAQEVYQERYRWVPQEELSSVIRDAMIAHPPPTVGRRYLRITRPRQERVAPPTFGFTVNHPEMLHFSYQRYLENALRSAFGFRGNHLRLIFHATSERR